jgi:hypothetical protein
VELWGFVEAKKQNEFVSSCCNSARVYNSAATATATATARGATYHAFHFSHLFHFPFLEWLIEGMRLGKHACHVHDFTDVPAPDGLIESRAVFEHLRMNGVERIIVERIMKV